MFKENRNYFSALNFSITTGTMMAKITWVLGLASPVDAFQ
jgi:hypothetical protein